MGAIKGSLRDLTWMRSMLPVALPLHCPAILPGRCKCRGTGGTFAPLAQRPEVAKRQEASMDIDASGPEWLCGWLDLSMRH